MPKRLSKTINRIMSRYNGKMKTEKYTTQHTIMINGKNKNLPWVYNDLYLMYYTSMGQVNIKQEVIKKRYNSNMSVVTSTRHYNSNISVVTSTRHL